MLIRYYEAKEASDEYEDLCQKTKQYLRRGVYIDARAHLLQSYVARGLKVPTPGFRKS